MSLYLGSRSPAFSAPSPRNPSFAFPSLGGHWVLLAFLPPPGPARDAALDALNARRNLFLRPDGKVLLFGVIPDPETFALARETPPGISWFDDSRGEVRRLFDNEAADGSVIPEFVLIDPSLRIHLTAPLSAMDSVLETVSALPPVDGYAGTPLNAPVLIVPRVFERDVCKQLIDLYDSQGGQVSGVMRERDGRTVPVIDNFKRRRDAAIEDAELRAQLRARIQRRLLPEIEKAFQFKATRLERYIVACYDAAEGGYFRAHRDNTTAGTAHRRFAVSINLNAEDFEGGDLRFPEFGNRTYRPPTGGAVVFCCSMLHEATPVTRGVRYAFLPFLYDEEGAAIRAANLHLLDSQPAA